MEALNSTLRKLQESIGTEEDDKVRATRRRACLDIAACFHGHPHLARAAIDFLPAAPEDPSEEDAVVTCALDVDTQEFSPRIAPARSSHRVRVATRRLLEED